jgi:hypothetical protein
MTPDLPANRLLLLTRRRTGSNFEGLGLLRPCYPWWKLKAHVYDQTAIGMERWAVPTPRVRFDFEKLRTQAEVSNEDIKTMVANAKETAKRYRTHELGYLSGPDGIDFDTFGDGAFNPQLPETVLNLCDRQMLMPWGLQFLLLGTNDTGSRAVGEVQASFFRRIAINGLDYVAAQIGGTDAPGSGTVGRLMRWNFPDLDESEWPRLQHEGLDPGPLLDVISSLGFLATTGVLTPTNDLENMIRQAFKAPVLTEENKRSPDERIAGGSPAAAAQALMRDRAARLGRQSA